MILPSLSQLMQQNQSQLRDASAKVSFMTLSASNKGDGMILRTAGQATLPDFIVAPRQRSQATTSSSLRELRQGRSVQIGKEKVTS